MGILVTKHPAGENRQEGSGVQTRGGLNGGVQRPHKSFFRMLEWGKKKLASTLTSDNNSTNFHTL